MTARTCAILVLVFFAVASPRLAGQGKPAPMPADFGQWETLVPAGTRGGLSPDGAWLVYAINRSSRENELRIVKIADRTTKTAAFGTQPAFSADSKWIAYAIGYSEAQEEKLRKDKKPVQRKLGLLDLARGETTVVDGIESFAFDASGAHLAMRRYPPEKTPRDAAPAPEEAADETPGATLIVRTLATGRDTTFGTVSEYAWQDKGPLLAAIVTTDDKTGNGVHLFDPSTGVLRVIDSAASTYSGLTWRKDSADLAVLRSKPDARPRRTSPREWTTRRAAGA